MLMIIVIVVKNGFRFLKGLSNTDYVLIICFKKSLEMFQRKYLEMCLGKRNNVTETKTMKDQLKCATRNSIFLLSIVIKFDAVMLSSRFQF